MRIFSILVFVLSLTACKDVQTVVNVELYNIHQDLVGEAKFSEHPEGVEIFLQVEGLTPGYHAVHIHEVSKCEGPDFKTAGNHWNPEQKEHGLMNPEGAHLGDLPNILADDQGKVSTNLLLNRASLLDKEFSLVEGRGTSIIIHETADDGMSQPAGDSGDRIVCGMIVKEKDR